MKIIIATKSGFFFGSSPVVLILPVKCVTMESAGIHNTQEVHSIMMNFKQHSNSRFANFATEYVSAPSRPDVDRLIIVPHRTIYNNISADRDASVTRLVQDLNEPIGFAVYLLERL